MGRLMFFFVMMVIACNAQPPRPEEESEPLAYGIIKGTYPVSYRAMATYDLTRPAIPDQSLSGVELRTFANVPGRQMQIHLWYPTSSPGRPMRF
jgi:hypothetical protein